MNDKDKIIASLRKQLQDALSRNRALEQEVTLLKHLNEEGKIGCFSIKYRVF